ncbi:rhomboid family intramembrane serine protease [Conexibacter sp. JD483]|nr:rhomboid family intramembrane serine protease [Conexibacter sp. JD483]MDR9369304.1 rhomboid family intramembrane serine protease [Conexibacter sp. JD483]
MTPTPVGMRCPECAKEKTRVQRGPVGGGASLASSGLSVTVILLAACVLVFVGEMASGGQIGQAGGTLYQNFALWRPALEFNNEYYRMITYGFLHSGFLHILFNGWFIWVLGNMLEPALGKLRFAVLYFATLLTGAFGALVMEPNAAGRRLRRGLRPARRGDRRGARPRYRHLGLRPGPGRGHQLPLHLPVPGDLGRRPRRRLPRRPADRLRLPAGRSRAAAVRARRGRRGDRRAGRLRRRRRPRGVGPGTTQRPRGARALR